MYVLAIEKKIWAQNLRNIAPLPCNLCFMVAITEEHKRGFMTLFLSLHQNNKRHKIITNQHNITIYTRKTSPLHSNNYAWNAKSQNGASKLTKTTLARRNIFTFIKIKPVKTATKATTKGKRFNKMIVLENHKNSCNFEDMHKILSKLVNSKTVLNLSKNKANSQFCTGMGKRR